MTKLFLVENITPEAGEEICGVAGRTSGLGLVGIRQVAKRAYVLGLIKQEIESNV